MQKYAKEEQGETSGPSERSALLYRESSGFPKNGCFSAADALDGSKTTPAVVECR